MNQKIHPELNSQSDTAMDEKLLIHDDVTNSNADENSILHSETSANDSIAPNHPARNKTIPSVMNLNDSELVEQRAMSHHLFEQRERLFHHASFERETAFYESVCSGNIEKVRMLSTPLCSAGYGILSNDPLQNLKYHFVVSVAMLTRYCITAGMSPEDAYNTSDVYIMRADVCTTEEAVHALHAEMLAGYTKKMRSIVNGKIYSKPIVKALDYISEHLHQHISLHDTAKYLGLSKAYLSRLFKDETDIVFNEYVRIKKVEAASDMIRFSDFSFLEISNLLCFSSQSYFIKVFREYTGMTPKEYRNCYHLSLK